MGGYKNSITDVNNRVGIGRTPVAASLEVEGQVRVTGTSGYTFNAGGDTDGGMFSTADGTINFRTNGSERMRIDSSGRVGIGTSSPNYPLTTYSSTAGSQFIASFGKGLASNEYVAIGLSGFVASNGATKAGIALKRTNVYGTGELHFLNNNTLDNSDATLSDSKMVIDSSGNVGIGTAPSYPLHIVGSHTIYGAELSTSSTATTSYNVMRWTQGAGSGAPTGYIGTGGSAVGNTGFAGAFGIGTQTSAPVTFLTNDTERMRITSGGNVLIGTTSNIVGGIGGHSLVIDAASQNLGIKTASGNQQAVRFANDATAVGSINLTTTSTSYATSSDYRLKENVVEMTGALDRVDALKPSRFNFIADPEKTVDGFLAHEVQAIVPEAVTGEKDAVDEEGNPIYQGIDQSKIVPLLVGAIKELRAEIELLKSQING